MCYNNSRSLSPFPFVSRNFRARLILIARSAPGGGSSHQPPASGGGGGNNEQRGFLQKLSSASSYTDRQTDISYTHSADACLCLSVWKEGRKEARKELGWRGKRDGRACHAARQSVSPSCWLLLLLPQPNNLSFFSLTHFCRLLLFLSVFLPFCFQGNRNFLHPGVTYYERVKRIKALANKLPYSVKVRFDLRTNVTYCMSRTVYMTCKCTSYFWYTYTSFTHETDVCRTNDGIKCISTYKLKQAIEEFPKS
jgi:hypothetical protein